MCDAHSLSCLDKLARFFSHSAASKDLNQAGGLFPARLFCLFQTCESQNQYGGETKGIRMNHPIRLKTTTPPLLITLTLLCFGLLPRAQAVVPPPDGDYPGFNTAEGQKALFSLTSGTGNVAVGWGALYSDTQGSLNTAIGTGALLLNIGDQNTATGAGALLFNNNGIYNTANGAFALHLNTEGDFNTANGFQALFNNTIGGENTATGYQALFRNTTGSDNTANGFGALSANTTGTGNTALGTAAGNSVTTANGVICIGAGVLGADVDNTTWIGNVYGVATQSGTTAPVVVSDTGQLGTAASSERFKKDIATMEKASEAILSLRPVTFHYKTDSKGISQFGLIAEEVAKVNPALVLPDKEGKPYSVRYDQVNAMLLNEFLKEHRRVQELEATIAQLKAGAAKQEAINAEQRKGMEVLTAMVKQQAAQIQKVSAQLELNKPAPQAVLYQ
jgi:Chaperone of endosialidase